MSYKQIFIGTEDCPFTIVTKINENKYSYSFEVYSFEYGWYKDKTENIPTEDFEKAELYLHGWLKWDHCLEIYFDSQNMESGSPVYLHFCGREHSKKIDKLFTKLFELGKILIPHWDSK